MFISKQTLDVLRSFSTINTHLVIKPGNKIETLASAKDIMASFEGDDKFEKQVAVFNLGELLGVVSAFDKPEFDLDDKCMTIKEGTQKVKYVYTDETMLTTPTKSLTLPSVDVEFELSASNLQRIQKMAGILAVEDLAIIGDGKKVIARVMDVANKNGNNYDIDLETTTTDKFEIHFKVEKLKLMSGMDYDVEISNKKISRFQSKQIKLTVYIAVEATSTFA